MNKLHAVLQMLRPNGGWVVSGDDFDGIRWDEGTELVTKKELDEGFNKYDTWKAEQDTAKIQAKAAAEGKLAALGLTTDDLRALGL